MYSAPTNRTMEQLDASLALKGFELVPLKVKERRFSKK